MCKLADRDRVQERTERQRSPAPRAAALGRQRNRARAKLDAHRVLGDLIQAAIHKVLRGQQARGEEGERTIAWACCRAAAAAWTAPATAPAQPAGDASRRREVTRGRASQHARKCVRACSNELFPALLSPIMIVLNV